MNESRPLYGLLFFYRIKKFVFKKKLELIEGRHLASIRKCFHQHYIGESMEIFNLVLHFLLIPQWNGEQDTSRSMPGSDLQLFPFFFEYEFFDSVFFKVP